MGGRCWNKPHKALGKGLVAARQFCPIGEKLLACFRSFDVIGCEDLNGGHFGKLHILRYLNIAAAGPPEGQLQLSKPSDLSVFVAKYKESDWRPSLNPAPSAPFLDRHLEGAHICFDVASGRPNYTPSLKDPMARKTIKYLHHQREIITVSQHRLTSCGCAASFV